MGRSHGALGSAVNAGAINGNVGDDFSGPAPQLQVHGDPIRYAKPQAQVDANPAMSGNGVRLAKPTSAVWGRPRVTGDPIRFAVARARHHYGTRIHANPIRYTRVRVWLDVPARVTDLGRVVNLIRDAIPGPVRATWTRVSGDAVRHAKPLGLTSPLTRLWPDPSQPRIARLADLWSSEHASAALNGFGSIIGRTAIGANARHAQAWVQARQIRFSFLVVNTYGRALRFKPAQLRLATTVRFNMSRWLVRQRARHEGRGAVWAGIAARHLPTPRSWSRARVEVQGEPWVDRRPSTDVRPDVSVAGVGGIRRNESVSIHTEPAIRALETVTREDGIRRVYAAGSVAPPAIRFIYIPPPVTHAGEVAPELWVAAGASRRMTASAHVGPRPRVEASPATAKRAVEGGVRPSSRLYTTGKGDRRRFSGGEFSHRLHLVGRPGLRAWPEAQVDAAPTVSASYMTKPVASPGASALVPARISAVVLVQVFVQGGVRSSPSIEAVLRINAEHMAPGRRRAFVAREPRQVVVPEEPRVIRVEM
ncbi:hypothetical protein CCR79_02300 [Halorhodospira halophila]|nr:hypothetical protein [Halorhodospira halophila]